MASDGLESKLSDAKFGRLKRIAKAMHNFYYPDFRTDIHNIAGYVRLYVDSIGGKKQEYVQKSLDLLKKIRDFYEEKAKKYRLDSWMFEELRNTRDLLPKLDNTLNLLFDTKYGNDGLTEKDSYPNREQALEIEFKGQVNRLLDYGLHYHSKLISLYARIKADERGKDFELKAKDGVDRDILRTS